MRSAGTVLLGRVLAYRRDTGSDSDVGMGVDVARLARQLLSRGGVAAPLDSLQRMDDNGGTNRTWLIRTDDGARFILRQYAWPHGGPELDRAVKEPVLHAALHARGVPVPRVVAVVHGADGQALLLEHVEGELLGDLDERDHSPHDREQAWHAVGSAVGQLHQLRYPSGTAGVIAGEHLRPFEEGSWGRFHVETILAHAQRLADRRPLPADMARLREVVWPAADILDDAASCLLHNDLHPWNVLVRRESRGWECAALLDWEYAWVGDPSWDLVRMDLFRRRDLGPTPEAFWQGYGTRPQEPLRSVYTLHIYLWMANEALDGSKALPFTYHQAIQYVHHLDVHLEHLAAALNVGEIE